MNITKILFLVAAGLFLIAALGFTVLPNPMIWGLFCLAVGLFLTGYEFNFKQR